MPGLETMAFADATVRIPRSSLYHTEETVAAVAGATAGISNHLYLQTG